MVFGTNIRCGRNLDPVRLDLRPAQHRLNALAALIGNDENSGALATSAASTAGPVLKPFGVTWQFDMDHQRQVGQIDTTRGNVSCHTYAGTAVTQRLKRLISL